MPGSCTAFGSQTSPILTWPKTNSAQLNNQLGPRYVPTRPKHDSCLFLYYFLPFLAPICLSIWFFSEKVYFRSQILERPSIGEYWNISGVPVLSENVIFMFFRTGWCYSEAYNTGMQNLSSIVQYSCTSIWDFKYTFSFFSFFHELDYRMASRYLYDTWLTWVQVCLAVQCAHSIRSRPTNCTNNNS